MFQFNEGYREFRLDNGLFVALQNVSNLTVSGRLRVWHGALNEIKGEEGIAHLLEHNLLFSGSQKYNPQQSDKIRETFGSINAYTSLDKTHFPVDMFTEDTDLFLEYISNTLFNPSFDKVRFEEEKKRVLREISDEKSSPSFIYRNEFIEAIFGKNSPQTYLVLGEEEVIRSSTTESLKNFHSRGYSPNNMDLILVGALPNNIENLISQNFGSFSIGDGKKIDLPRNISIDGAKIINYSAPDLLSYDDPEQSSAILNISFFAPNKTDEDTYAMSMLVNIFGGDINSRIFKRVSQRDGLAYGINAKYDLSFNNGVVNIACKVHSKKIDEAIDAIFEEMSKLQDDLVSKEDLERVKIKYKFGIAKVAESNMGHIAIIESKIDTGLSLEYQFKKMEEVDPEMIRNVALKYFPQNRKDGNYVLGLRDPLKK